MSSQPGAAHPAIQRAGAAAPSVHAEGLVRDFGHRRAVNGVDLTLHAGDALALFGPNGAGKTTLLKLLAGLLRPTAGSARIAGEIVHSHPRARAGIGMISHHTLLYGALNARENVEFAAGLYGLRDPGAAAHRAMERMRVLELGDVPVRTLSRGQQQRVSIARAIVHEPAVLLLDEPYSGLDAQGSATLTGLLLELRAAHSTLVIVTHNLHEGLSVASRVAIMQAGRLARLEDRAAINADAFAMKYRDLVVTDG